MYVQGKGHMRTFWVTGDGSSNGEEGIPPVDAVPTPPTASPPIQRVSSFFNRPSSAVNCRQRHASAPLGNSPTASPLSRRHSLAHAHMNSPKPNQWPQADQQLRRFNSDSVSIDSNTRPGRRTSSSGRIGREVERFQHQQTASIIKAQDSLNKRQLERKISLERAETFRSISSSSSLKLALPHTGQIMPPIEFSVGMGPEDALSEMEAFAAQAEENAQQARLLADWATSIVNQIKKEEGTPVDAAGCHAPALPHHGNQDEALTGQRLLPGPVDSSKCILM